MIDTSKMTDSEYILWRYGKDGKTALAIATAESHLNAYAINKNTDGTYDLGCWQLNEHWQKIKRNEAFNCRWSTDKAYEIYIAWGRNFNAWSAFKNKSYLRYK